MKKEITIRELYQGWLVSVESQKRDDEFACQTKEEVLDWVKGLMEELS